MAGLVVAGALTVLGGWPSVASAQDPVPSTTIAPTDPLTSTDVSGGTTPTTPTTPTTSGTPGSTGLDPEVTVPDTAEPAQTTPDTTEIDDENRKFAIVIAGLVAVAVALALLTFRYWRVTKPVPIGDDPDGFDDLDDDDDDGFGDEVGDGRDGGAGREDRGPGIDELDDDELFVSSGPRSRRAIAGADHADVGAGWEPMATGEQERVSGQVRRATSRPSPSDRARALGMADPSDAGR